MARFFKWYGVNIEFSAKKVKVVFDFTASLCYTNPNFKAKESKTITEVSFFPEVSESRRLV